jgi:hypothetical protein
MMPSTWYDICVQTLVDSDPVGSRFPVIHNFINLPSRWNQKLAPRLKARPVKEIPIRSEIRVLPGRPTSWPVFQP